MTATLILVCALTVGTCLAAIQFRHMGKQGFLGWLLHKEVRQALQRSLDATGKALALVALVAFIALPALIAFHPSA